MSNWCKQIAIVICCIGCSSTATKVDFVLDQKDLIPEGTAYNHKEEELYIGSINKQIILSLDQNGVEKVLVSADQFGKYSPLGLLQDVSEEIIWVCAAMSPLKNKTVKQWETTIIGFDSRSGKRIKTYEPIKSHIPIMFNDLTQTTEGQLFITESLNGGIYTTNITSDSLSLYFEFRDYSFPSGITNQNNQLYVATDQGIVKINSADKEVLLMKSTNRIDMGMIDGLEVTNGYFIGHQSDKVSKFYFNNSITEIVRSKILDSGDEFDSSTTGVVVDEHYLFIVNSQIRSGVDREKMELKPFDSLEEVLIRKIQL